MERLATIKGRLDSYKAEYEGALAKYKDAVRSNKDVAMAEAATRDVLRRWRAYTQELSTHSDLLQNSSESIDELNQLAAEIEEQRGILAKLRGKAITRRDQADTLNPKERDSPYTNILGLQRTFRSSTRAAIVVMSIIFGLLALAILSGIVYRNVSRTGSPSGGVIAPGGAPALFGAA